VALLTKLAEIKREEERRKEESGGSARGGGGGATEYDCIAVAEKE